MIASNTIFIKTSKFSIASDETIETNPCVFGKQFAEWMRLILKDKFPHVSQVQQEDYGWNILIQLDPYPLHVVCANRVGSRNEWGAFIAVKQSIFQKLFGKKFDSTVLNDAFDYIEAKMRNIPDAYDVSIE